MEKKLFTDLKIGDSIYCNYDRESIQPDEFIVTSIKRMDKETYHYREWAYADEEEYTVDCDKLRIYFKPVDEEKSYGWYIGNNFTVDLKLYNSYVLYSGQGVGHTWSPNKDICLQDKIDLLNHDVKMNTAQIDKLTKLNVVTIDKIQAILSANPEYEFKL